MINRLPSVVLNWKSPYEVLFKEKVNLTTIQPFGSLIYAANTSPHKSKFDARSHKCVFWDFLKTQRIKHYLIYLQRKLSHQEM